MFENIFGSLEQKQQEMMDKATAIVVETAVGGVRVTANGNREIVNISITDASILSDKEQLEDLLMVAVNRALAQAGEQADEQAAADTKKMMSSMFPLGSSNFFGQ